jgi:tetraacyldisaccharide 4'-kinase
MSGKTQTRFIQLWQNRGVWVMLLWPLSRVFLALVHLRRWLYRTGWMRSTRVAVPVVVVGNVVVGGVGKTPVVIALVEHFQSKGLRVGVVSRGYGRGNGPGNGLGGGHSADSDCLEVHPDGSAHDFGDESLLIRRSTGVPVFVARQRAQAAKALLAAYPGTQVIIADDGLQHYALQRDFEVCVFDDRGVGNGWLMPAGMLREPWPQLLKPSTASALNGGCCTQATSPVFRAFGACANWPASPSAPTAPACLCPTLFNRPKMT